MTETNRALKCLNNELNINSKPKNEQNIPISVIFSIYSLLPIKLNFKIFDFMKNIK